MFQPLPDRLQLNAWHGAAACARTATNGAVGLITTADGGTALRAESVIIVPIYKREILHANL